MKHQYLDWDSSFFERNVYKLETDNQTFLKDLEAVRPQIPATIYCVSKHLLSESDIMQTGAILYDHKLTFTKSKIQKSSRKMVDYIIRQPSEVTPELEQLAYQSGIYSRFNLDPILKVRYQELYRQWITKSVNKILADIVFTVLNENKDLAGFVTVKITENKGQIGLIAVDEGERGKGFGEILLHKAESFCWDLAIEHIEVITQQKNIPACSLYKKHKYQVEKKEYIYHLHL
jgi:dTDP-4-amino-4,6-dideoxy-D-galactose acyltransferase